MEKMWGQRKEEEEKEGTITTTDESTNTLHLL